MTRTGALILALVVGAGSSAAAAPESPQTAGTVEVVHAFEASVGIPLATLVEGHDGALYGTTGRGGRHGLGTIFKWETGVFSVVHSFDGPTTGSAAQGGLVVAPDGAIYGTAYRGGANDQGTVFKLQNGLVSVVHAFDLTNTGANPWLGLSLGYDGALYGTTEAGGTFGGGTLFKISGDVLTVLHAFDPANLGGWKPLGPPILAGGGALYGTTSLGGASNFGTIYRWQSGRMAAASFISAIGRTPTGTLAEAPDGTIYGTTFGGNGTVFKLQGGVLSRVQALGFSTGTIPWSGVQKGSDGALYGTTSRGGTSNSGTIFRIQGGTFSVVRSFPGGADGVAPFGGILQTAGGALYGTTQFGGQADLGVIFEFENGVYSVLHRFEPSVIGSRTYGRLTEGTDGALYGAASSESQFGAGSIYRLDDAGASLVQPFNRPVTGAEPRAGLITAPDGVIYGVTSSGGAANRGTLYRVQSGVLSVLYTFGASSGAPASPSGDLVVGPDGALYGTTTSGGANGRGTVFRYGEGAVSIVHSFDGSLTGFAPVAGLTLAPDGTFYGTTTVGGANNAGTLFQIRDGIVSVLHAFRTSTGFRPEGALAATPGGVLYGTTREGGGTGGRGTLFKLEGGAVSVIHVFDGPLTGANPTSGLVLAIDGSLYGTAPSGGPFGAGVVYRVSNDVVTVVHAFTRTDDGAEVNAPLLQSSDGHLYGSAQAGGPTGAGTIFRYRIPGATPAGAGVTVQPPVAAPDGSARSLSVTFDSVARAGVTTGTASSSGAPLPDGYKLGDPPMYYDVRTTATFTGAVTLCFGWNEGEYANENNLRLFHFANEAWSDITTAVDPAANQICGVSTTLSPFVIAEPTYEFLGFGPPLQVGAADRAGNAGRTYPVKFRLRWKGELWGGAAATLAVSGSNGPVAAGTFRYDAEDEQYVFNLSTRGWPAGTYQLVVRVDDGGTYTTVLTLR